MTSKKPFPEPDSLDQSQQQDYFRTGHLKTDLALRTARGGAVTIASQGLTFVISLGATAVMARLLSPQDYGLIGMVAVFTNFVAMFKDMGLSAATIQRAEINYDQISTLFWLNVALSVAVMALAAALAPAVAWFYGDSRLLRITVVTSLGFIIGGMTVQHEALLRRQMRFFALAVIALISVVVGYLVGITMAWNGFSYWALVFSQLALVACNTVAVWSVCRWRPGIPRLRSGVRSMVTFGGNLTGFTTINYFSRNLDNLLIGRVWGAQQLGLYSKAYQLMMLPIDQINMPVGSVAVPALSRLTDTPDRYRLAYLRMLEKVAIVTMPAVALMIGSSDWVVRIVLGPQWSEASRIFVLLGITGLFQPIANTTGWLLLAQGRGDRMLQWGLISGPLTMGSIIVGMPWGAVGVAAAYMAVKLCITDPLLFWFVGRSGPVRTMDFYRTMAPFVFASCCVLLALFGFRQLHAVNNPAIGIAISFLITVVTTSSALLLIPAGRRALQDLKSLLFLLKGRKEESLIRQ
jgi:O-antigen/teichoic acid export membrane protein